MTGFRPDNAPPDRHQVAHSREARGDPQQLAPQCEFVGLTRPTIPPGFPHQVRKPATRAMEPGNNPAIAQHE